MGLGLNINTYPGNRWTVTWAKEDFVKDNSTRHGLMYILFDEMKLSRASFGCLLNNDESEWLEINSNWYWQNVDDLGYNILSKYVLTGVLFDEQEQAVEFIDLLNKLYFVAILQKGL